MNNLLKFVQSATPGQSVQFRRKAYGKEGVRQFLRDVLAMANADVDGARYIITGAEVDENGRKKAHGVSKGDFSGDPSYQSLVTEFIEPPIRIKYQPVTVGGKRVGAYVIADCQDKPYMMRIDFSEKLRRGDAYMCECDTCNGETRAAGNCRKCSNRKFRDVRLTRESHRGRISRGTSFTRI